MIKTIFAAVDLKPKKDLDKPLRDAVLKKIKEFQLKLAVDLQNKSHGDAKVGIKWMRRNTVQSL